ncbi:OLC1v1018264C1 [Oldenlandia corymbosa var. corymbosa]|uniref:OLC1v1018264C1 n=1 Tax=Oldenlandia corymbosa var. corymbosa TaxID=529605 RepID=A0AAV1EB87_OLDCO|nr:OLC1v1018264C1 [Oldenlandia corymbosa var. corymbosa]
MDAAIMFHSSSSPDQQPISPYKTTHKKGAASSGNNNGGNLRRLSSISRPSENFIPPLNFHNSSNPSTGLLPPPTTPTHQLLLPTFHNSYPPFSIQKRQPPLLPLPISPTKPNLPTQRIQRGLSLPLPSTTTNNRKAHHNNKVHITPPKKSKSIITHKRPSGPDPKDLPKDIVPKTFTFLSSGGGNHGLLELKLVDEFSGSVAFSTISPPPSSLPLPTFSLRPKLSCNAAAAAAAGGGGGAIDAGATDNLCRLLRLR